MLADARPGACPGAGQLPVVGVVIAAYDAARFLPATLESLLAQTYPSWTCVVVDDGSRDATAGIADSFARRDERIGVHRKANGGVSAARNAGVRALPPEASLLCFLDADDLLSPSALETLVGALRPRPDAAGVSGWAEYIDVDGNPVDPGVHRAIQTRRPASGGLRARLLRPDEDTTFDSLLLYGSIWPPATALLRRELFDLVGGFDESLRHMEDWDLFIRLSRNAPIAYVDSQVAWYRRHDGNATRASASSMRAGRVVRAKAWASPDNTPAQRRAALVNNLRSLSWDLHYQLQAARLLLPRRPMAAAWCMVCALYVLVQAACVRPVVPSPRLVEALARQSRRLGLPDGPAETISARRADS